jgi:hypothetical protein
MCPRKITRGLLATLVLALASLAGCSSQKSVPARPASDATTLSIVSQRDLAAVPGGSPQRTVLNWWRLTQFKVVQDGLAQFTPAARRQLEKAGYPTFVIGSLGPWLRNGQPQIQHVDVVNAKHAVVYTQTVFKVPLGNDLVRHNVDVLAFALERRRGAWLLSDPSWVIAQANSLRQAQLAAQRNAARRGPG